MRRREFLLGGAALTALPNSPLAQEPGRTYRLGALIPAPRDSPGVAAFFDELRLFGFIEGQNLTVIPGGFDVPNDRLTDRAGAQVAAMPDAIICGPDTYARSLQQATRTIAIISMTEDMVAEGLVASLARPGGNTTGISLLSPELDGKRQDILIDAVPGVRRIAALADATATSNRHLQLLQAAARGRGVDLSISSVARRAEVLPAIEAAKAAGVQALNLLASPLFTINSRVFIERIAALRLPAVHQWPEVAEDGGLLGYGPRFTHVWRQRARLVARVLRGVKPADIPVEQPTHFELVVNLKTAKTIGHEVPAGLILRADKVIE